MRAPLAPPRLSVPRNVDADAHAVETSWETDSPEARICSLRAAMSSAPISSCVTAGTGSCQSSVSVRDLRAEVARDRAHVAVRQLEPRPGEGVRELVRVLEEAPRDRLVDRVEPQREVGRQHRRGRASSTGRGDPARCSPRRRPSAPTGCAPAGLLRQLPLVAEQVLEEAVVPRRRRGRPGDLEAAGDRVAALAGAEAVLPAEALLLEGGGLGLGADVLVRVGRAVGLAERVAAGDERDGLLVVHRHAAERLADVPGRGERVRVAVRALPGSRR